MNMWTKALVMALLCLAGTFAKNGDIDWTHLDVTYMVFGGHYHIPSTLPEFLKADSKYSLMSRDADLNVDFYSYPSDPRVSVGFDSYGNVAAIRMGIPKADIMNKAVNNGVEFMYTYDDKPLYTSGKFWNIEVYYTTALFTSPGIHYILGMSPSLACEDHQGPFLIYVDGDLVSLGWFPFGTFTSTRQRTWFEDPPKHLTKTFAPNAPDCFQDWAGKYGVISFHIFLKKYSQLNVCLLGANKSACK